MDDWGQLEVTKIIDGEYFWCLFDELCDDKSNFLHNRSNIVEAYKNGNLYGLQVIETDEMCNRRAKLDTIFCNGSFYLLPCFIIKENNQAIIIWTHSRARNKGFARKMIELLEINSVYNPLLESMGFWEKVKIKMSP